MSVKNLYHYTYTNVKKYCSLVFSYTFSQINKREFDTLRKNCYNSLNINFLGVFLMGVFIFTIGIIYCTSIRLPISNVIKLCSSINIYIIYLYFVNTVLLFILISLYAFMLKKILLINSIKKTLPQEFISRLSYKTKIKDRFIHLFSLTLLKIFLLTSFFVLLANLLYYIYYDSFLSPDKSIELFIYVLYISICYNISNCYINGKKFFSKCNICNIGHSFILLLLAKTTAMYLMPLLLPYLIILNEYTHVNKHIDSVEKNTLKFLKRLPLVNKLVFIKIHNNSVFFNSPVAKFRYNNTAIPLNNSNIKYITKINFLALTMCNNKPNSVIISAIQCANKRSSCLMFTYNDRSNFIAIDRLSVVNIPNIDTQILHVDKLGFLPKSGYFNKSNNNLVIKPKALEISALSNSNGLLKDTTCYKAFSDCLLIEKKVSEFTVNNKQKISSPFDIFDLGANVNNYNLDIKTNNFINNISPDLLNPFVFMMNLPNQNPDGDEFNNSNNKGKGKATQEDMRAWDNEESAQELVQMEIDTDTSELERAHDQAVLNLITPEELAQQSNIIYPEKVIDTDYELLMNDLSIYEEDLADISSSIDLLNPSGGPINQGYFYRKDSALYRIITEYGSYFDEDSGNKYNVHQGLIELNDYLGNQRKAIYSKILELDAIKKGQNTVFNSEPVVTNTSESELKNAYQTDKLDSVWPKLAYSSVENFKDAVNLRFKELCGQYYIDDRVDDINVTLMMKKARQQIVNERKIELGDRFIDSNYTPKHERRILYNRVHRAKDPSYTVDRNKIAKDKTLSTKEKEIQLEARVKLHKDILNEYKKAKRAKKH